MSDLMKGFLSGVLILFVVQVLLLLLWGFKRRPKGQVVRLTITKEWIMLTKGKAATFTVTAFNAEKEAVPLPADLVATASNGTPTFDAASGKGSVTPTALGDETITVTSAGVTGTVSDTVQPDPTVASLVVAFD
jgi:hypothetical protein